MNRTTLLRWQLDVSWSLLAMHLDGLSDDECLWEPSPNSWNVRRHADGRWAADWAVPEPEPVPIPSIGWLTWHIGFWWDHAHANCFGAAHTSGERLDWSAAATATPWPGGAAAAVEWIGACRDRWHAAIDPLTDADLDSTARSGWFADGTLTLAQVLAWANVELMKNAAEIGLLRNLHRATPTHP